MNHLLPSPSLLSIFTPNRPPSPLPYPTLQQNALGPTLPRHGVSKITQPPPSLMALPFGSHDKVGAVYDGC